MNLPQIDLLVHGMGSAYANGTATAFLAGTSTLATWYSDSAGTTPAANPYTLNVSGAATLYAKTRLKIDVKNSAGVSAPGFPIDQLAYPAFDNATIPVSAYATLNAAIASLGSTVCTLLLDSATTCTADLTIPTNTSIQGSLGGIVTVSTGKTLTMTQLEAGSYQVFAGSGAVLGMKEARPEWFGAKADGTTDDSAAFTRMLSGVGAGQVIKLSDSKTYVVGNGILTISGIDNLTIDGNGATLKAKTPVDAYPNIYTISFTNCIDFVVKNVCFDRRLSVDGGLNTPSGILVTTSRGIIADNVFKDVYDAIKIVDSPNMVIRNNRNFGAAAYSTTNETNKITAHQFCYVTDTSGDISNNGIFEGNYSNNSLNLIYINNGRYWSIKNNYSNYDYDSPIYVKSPYHIINGNTVNHPGKDGIKTLWDTSGGASGGGKSLISNNRIIRPGWNRVDGGVALNVYGGNHQLFGNYIELDNPAAVANPSGTIGVVIDGYATSLYGNTIIGPSKTVANVIGVLVGPVLTQYVGNIHSINIHNNQISLVYSPIQVRSKGGVYRTSDVKISENTIKDCYNGAAISGASSAAGDIINRTSILNNNLIDLAATAILYQNTNGGKIDGNNLVGPGSAYGMTLLNSSYLEIWHNIVTSYSTGVYGDIPTTNIGTHLNIFYGVTTDYNFLTGGSQIPR